ncbi:hypothetical protein M0802_009442 [Mischocyttarus mexicanus]|nr:hypothetical protein M0802_009442 [Mischocyttarus mexicanus]
MFPRNEKDRDRHITILNGTDIDLRKQGRMYKTGLCMVVMESKDNEAGSDELTDKAATPTAATAAAEGRNRINEFSNDYSIRLYTFKKKMP